LLPEEIHEVQRRLIRRRCPVLERVGHVEESAEPRRRATGDARVDPIADAHAVQRHARRCIGPVRGLLTGRVEVTPKQRVHLLELPIGVRDG
jgi:hypothetical protein